MHLRRPTPQHDRISIHSDPLDVLRETSRTFYFSIIDLPPGLHEAVMSAYLSLRALDEIEDHPRLDRTTKVRLLRGISSKCQRLGSREVDKFAPILEAYWDKLPEVTRRLGEWIALAPRSVASHICDANSAMAQRMAYWVDADWLIRTKADLDCYTFSVAGAVGLLLSDLWEWHDGTPSSRGYAIGFGRGLQAVNILRNRAADLARGVNFFPVGWGEDELRAYATENLTLADAYVEALSPGPARDFCRLPLALAYATLDALACGEPKLSRQAVLEMVGYERSLGLET